MNPRTFEDRPAVRERTPLLIGLTGPSSSGKTYSALRLATGVQQVAGGEIFVVDTEARRALHYADRFKFRHLAFEPPFGPLDYLAAIEHCVAKGAGVIVIDSMSHEHSGPGGVLDRVETYLDKKCGDDEGARRRNLMVANIKPKRERKQLNNRIVQLGVNAIFCYRAAEKIKPVKGGEPERLGWQPDTTSPLVYEMTARFLLPPGSDGRPSIWPETDAEKRMVKNPAQFREWFTDGMQLDEALGEKLAQWSAGDEKPPTAEDLASLIAVIEMAPTVRDIKAAAARTARKAWTAEQRAKIKTSIDARQAELRAETSTERQPGEDG